MFKDLRTSTKLVLLCSVFMIAIAATTYSLVREKLIAIEFARKELIGIKYLEVARRIYAVVLASRAFDPSGSSASDSLRDIFRDLATNESNAAPTLQTGEPAQALATALQLWSSGTESRAAALNVIAKAQQLAGRIADDLNLTLDPDLDSYYVQTLIAKTLPAFLRQLAELQSLAREASVTKLISNEQNLRFQFLMGLLRSSAEEVQANVTASYRGNRDGSLENAIAGAFATMHARTNSYLDGLSASFSDGDKAAVGVVAADPSYGSVANSAVGAWSISEAELERLLQKRIDGLVGRMRWSLALTGALAGLSILVAAMTHWHLVRPLKRLENVASSVREFKDYGLRINYSSKDEIGTLVLAFNKMLSELAAAHERERSEQSELARVSRLTTVGAMTASIAHEINQPLAAIITNSSAAQRFLSITPPDLDEVRAALKDIVMDGQRASHVIKSVRAIFKKDSGRQSRLAVNDLVEEIFTFVRGALQKHGVLIKRELLPGLQHVKADRTQLQQVIMNLIMNAVEAMAVTDHDRLLIVRSDVFDVKNVIITIEDFWTGN